MKEKKLGEIVRVVRARLLFYHDKLCVFNYSICLTYLLTLGIAATTYSQRAKIDLNIHNLKLKQAFPILEYKDKIKLLYNEENTSINRNVLKMSDAVVLDRLLKLENKRNYQTLEDGVGMITDKHQIRA